MTPTQKFAAMQELVGKENISIKETLPNIYSVLCGIRFISFNSKRPYTIACAGQGETEELAILDDWELHVSNIEEGGYLTLEYDDGTKKYARWLGEKWFISYKPFWLHAA